MHRLSRSVILLVSAALALIAITEAWLRAQDRENLTNQIRNARGKLR